MRPILAMLALALCASAQGQERSAAVKDVALWYQAFDRNDPALLDRILSETWVEVPPAPGQPAGPDGAKQILAQLRTAFPDMTIKMQEVLQDGNKVIARSEIAGTQRNAFLGFAAKHRKMTIQAIDIHEFKDGKIVRTWHTEDWLTGLHQLGLLDN
jgi:steroid delta-isomerase-like uncharacterized protein